MIKQPVTQKRLTNIAIVRLKTHGKRFEIACYRNKVLNWREGIEKDINEVIQTDTVFENVSKGVWAKEKDLSKAFGTTDLEAICRQILKTGDLQVSDKEREVHSENLFRDVATLVLGRLVHPRTGRQHTLQMTENALRSVGWNVQDKDTAKKQSLKAIEVLCSKLPESFARARMRLRITCPAGLRAEIRRHLEETCDARIEEDLDGDRSLEEAGSDRACITFTCEPSHYRELDKLATVTHAEAGVALQMVTNCVHEATLAAEAPLSVAAPAAADAAVPLAAAASSPAAAPAAGLAKKGPKCSGCRAEFEDVAEFRAHCKGDWHNFNQKRKVKGMEPVSEEECREIGLDAIEGFLGADS